MRYIAIFTIGIFVACLGLAQGDYESELKLAQEKLSEGKKLFEGFDYLGAIGVLSEALDNNPDLWEAYYFLGMCYDKRGENLDAVEAYEQALEINPDIEGLEEYLNKLRYEEQTGETYLAAGSTAAQAREYVEKGKAFWDAGDKKQAASAIGTALRLNPGLPEANFAAGYIYQQQGALSKSEQFYQKAINIKPDYKEALNNLGLVHLAQGYYAKALYDFSRVIELEYTFMQAYYNRAGTYAAQYDYETAIKEIVKVIAQDDFDLDAHNNLAIYYEHDGDITGAMKEWRKLLELLDKPEAHSESDSKEQLRAQAEEHLGKMAVYEEEATAQRLARENRWRRVRFGLGAGWAQASLGEMDAEIAATADLMEQSFLAWLTSRGAVGLVTRAGSSSTGGINLGGDLGYMLTRNFGVATRERVTRMTNSSIILRGVGKEALPSGGLVNHEYEFKMAVDLSLIAILFGGMLEFGEPGKISFRMGGYAGPIFGLMKAKFKERTYDAANDLETISNWRSSASGSGIGFEATGDLAIPFGKHSFGFIELGYRAAKIGAVTDRWDWDDDGTKDKWQSTDSSADLQLDLSGPVFSMGYRLSM
jgi:Tfp pilus assembly protein PilF